MTGLELTSGVLLCLGTFFCLVGGVGIHRMPDFYARTHAASITDTLGAGLMLVGLMFLCGDQHWTVLVKLAMVLLFLLLTSPTSGHALVKAAAAHGVRFAETPRAGEDSPPPPGAAS
ncbi:MAG: monovalent cation/H(+) antiporter subunit G [Myxococcota bacterium]|nr:monovalent cation/H(+) antiporter subunit G [Myxococcota bacterium]